MRVPTANTSAATIGTTSTGGKSSTTPVPTSTRATASSPTDSPNVTMNWLKTPNSVMTIASRLRSMTSRNDRSTASIGPTSPRTTPAGTYTNGADTTSEITSDT